MDMNNSKKIEFSVGLFMLLMFASLFFIFLKVVNINSISSQNTYKIYANFSDIGGLKVRAPIKVGGVVIGRVSEIKLDPKDYYPLVQLEILNNYNQLPDSSAFSIKTSGLLGDQYISVNVGFYDEEMGVGFLKEGDIVKDTKSAVVLEDLIGQFLYKDSSDPSGSSQKETNQPNNED